MGDLETMINDTNMKRHNPAIMTIDIETSPIIAYTWGPKWETNLLEVLEESKIMSFSAKLLGGKQVTKGLPDYKGYRPGVVDDAAIVKDLHKLFDTAEILVTQNGRDFDVRTINSRFLKHGMSPPSPYKIVDTKIEARKTARLPSHALEDMGAYFGLGHKMKHEGFALWTACIAGDLKAWKRMKNYNAQDVRLTEKVYLKLRPFMKTHPNVGVYSETEDCPKCGSDNVNLRGFAYNSTTKYQRAQCQDCHGWYRVGKPIRLEHKPGVGV